MGQKARLSITVERGKFLSEGEVEDKDAIKFRLSGEGDPREYVFLVHSRDELSDHWRRFVKTPYYMEGQLEDTPMEMILDDLKVTLGEIVDSFLTLKGVSE
jgi:hypothetical protein